MDDIKMFCGNNNMLNMLGIGNQYNYSGIMGIGNSYNNCGNFNIFSGVFGNNSFYGNCCGDFNYDRAAGLMLGQSLANIAVAAIGSLTGSSRANSKEALSTNVESLNLQIKTELGKIGKGITESNYATHNAREESWYVDGVKTANDTITTQKNIMDSVVTIDTDKKTVADYPNAKKDLDAKIAAETDPTAKAELEKELNLLDANYINATNNVKKYNDAKDKHDKAVTDKETLETEAETEQGKIEQIAKKITELIEQRDKIKGNLDTKVFDKADGNKLNRLNEDDYNNKFNQETGVLKADASVDKETLRRAFFNYRKATDEEKPKIKKQIEQLWSKLPKDERTNSLQAAYDVLFPNKK